MPGIKKNFFYSAFLTTANYIFPLLTLPYVTRVLGVNNYGICGFIDGIINYFILFSTMGIAVVGIREIAVSKGNRHRLSTTFGDLLALNAIFTFLSILILLVCTFLIPKLNEQKELMFFGAFKVGFNFLLIEWFYKGIEDFKFITIRTLLVKCLYVVGVFLLVKQSSDYPIYYLLSVLMIAVNAVINIVYSKKFLSFSFHDLHLTRYLRAMVTYGVYAILTSFYTTFNVVYLGFVSSDIEVGYYTTATKLYSIFIAMVGAFTGVMMPRMSSLLGEGKFDEFKLMYKKSVDLLASITIPVVVYAIIMTPDIIMLLAGRGYDGAITPMRLVMPLLFIIGYEQIMIVQGLMPLNKDRIVLKNSICGAVVGIIANIILVKQLAAIGSSLVWLICEFLIMILSQLAITHCIGEKFPFKVMGKNILVYVPLVTLYWFRSLMEDDNFFALLITGLISLTYFLIVQWFMFPESLCGRLIKKSVNKVLKRG